MRALIGPALLHLAVAILIVVGVWARQLRTRNAGIVDAAWVFIIGLGALIYAVCGSGALLPRLATAALAGAWALRLGGYLAMRNAGPREERRYARLRSAWGAAADRRMLGFFVVQALIAWALALSFVPICARPQPPSAAWWALGLALGLVGLVGEALADAQLARFRRDPRNAGRVLDTGLWRYSRHPNFFFECVYWFAYPCLAFGAPGAWLSLLGPLAIVFLLLKVSGVPTVEEAEAASRRAGYAEYVRRTSAFIPLPPRRE